jgi:hypothetical protein
MPIDYFTCRLHGEGQDLLLIRNPSCRHMRIVMQAATVELCIVLRMVLPNEAFFQYRQIASFEPALPLPKYRILGEIFCDLWQRDTLPGVDQSLCLGSVVSLTKHDLPSFITHHNVDECRRLSHHGVESLYARIHPAIPFALDAKHHGLHDAYESTNS